MLVLLLFSLLTSFWHMKEGAGKEGRSTRRVGLEAVERWLIMELPVRLPSLLALALPRQGVGTRRDDGLVFADGVIRP